ncbi:deoxynucleoside triphosphate triphosphohydrolase SAMHD1 [Nothobranchius furzeri]|uniref:Deoxynucleoside triphosphate triphosphohydrolase SAMHD1-like n=1 Tax=Nothobranchius furzeri TaxID=105023 RepID=A0A9D2XXW8_NOTFU|nr:deoxynucleoside triphosphate triphosphohydrolase SAMHD1-like [Nothobranchius furzeri]
MRWARFWSLSNLDDLSAQNLKEETKKREWLASDLAKVVVFDYGKEDKDPIENVRFYSKSHPNKPIQIIKKKVSKLLPETFKEQQIRVYCKRTDETTLEAAKSAFKE